jgi:peptidylprolyl isomerase
MHRVGFYLAARAVTKRGIQPVKPEILSPRVFFDVAINNRPTGRLVFELFSDQLPVTSENFRALCTGETGLGYWLKPRHYKDTRMHRIVSGLGAQGGDFNLNNGRMGESIYGQFFRDEKFLYKHDRRGLLTTANANKAHTNTSQFVVTFNALPHLDGKHVVFGQVVAGWETLDAIEAVASIGGKPSRLVTVQASGELTPSEVVALRIAAKRPGTLAVPDVYDPVPDEVYRKAGAFWNNKL